MPDTLENPTATEPVQAEPDLLPCPWCGTAENVRVDMGHYYGEVTCWNCKGAISWGPEKTTRAEAIAAWNTRHTSDLAERIEGLVSAAKDCADDLEANVRDRWCYVNSEPHPGNLPKFEQDMEPVRRVRTILAALKEVNSHDRT